MNNILTTENYLNTQTTQPNKEILPQEENSQIKKKEQNKIIEKYIKKKVSTNSNNTTTTNYKTENLNSSQENKYILNKLNNRKVKPKNAFFNTSMSFDINNDNKNASFDKDSVAKYEKENKREGSSDEKNLINSLKNPIKITNNENYIIKKSVNKKFETIREEDEENQNNNKSKKYQTYFNKFERNSRNINKTENNNNNISNNTSIKKNSINNVKNSTILDNFNSNKKNISSISPIKKTSISPGIKNSGNTSRYTENTVSKLKDKYNNTISDNLPKIGKSTYGQININKITKTDMNNYSKKIREKNSSLNTEGRNNKDSISNDKKYKKLEYSKIEFQSKTPEKRTNNSIFNNSRKNSSNSKTGDKRNHTANKPNNTTDSINSEINNSISSKRGSNIINSVNYINSKNNRVNPNNFTIPKIIPFQDGMDIIFKI